MGWEIVQDGKVVDSGECDYQTHIGPILGDLCLNRYNECTAANCPIRREKAHEEANGKRYEY